MQDVFLFLTDQQRGFYQLLAQNCVYLPKKQSQQWQAQEILRTEMKWRLVFTLPRSRWQYKYVKILYINL